MPADAPYLPERPRRSVVSRIVALAALAAAVVVVYVVISGSLSVGDDSSSDTGSEQTTTVRKNKGEIPKKYTVGEGESLSAIAEKYSISLKRIERLNPGIDPNTLATGTVIKLH